MDLRLDFDLSDQKGQSQAWSRLLSHSPSVLVLSPFGQPPASRVGVSASGKVTKKGLKELSDKLDSRKKNQTNICEAQLAFCLRAAWHQLEHGRSFIWLMDVQSPHWNHQGVLALSKHAWWISADLSAFDRNCKNSISIMYSNGLSPTALQPLRRRCSEAKPSSCSTSLQLPDSFCTSFALTVAAGLKESLDMRQEFLLSDVFVGLTVQELDVLSYATETYRFTLPGIANIGTSLLSISEMKPVILRSRMANKAIETMNSLPAGFHRHYRNQIPDRRADPDGYHAGMGIKDLTISCFPTLTFANAAVFKGCFTRRHKLYAKILDGEAFVIMWRTGSSDHKF